jgi:hypothetical protein
METCYICNTRETDHRCPSCNRPVCAHCQCGGFCPHCLTDEIMM